MDFASLSHVLFNYFDWHPARINVFAQSILSLIMSGSVTLKHMAQGFQNDAKMNSSLRRLQRFLKDQIIDSEIFGIMIRDFMGLHGKVFVAIDRTNWDFGIFHINFLFVTVIYGKVSIPIVWTLLDKEGNSNTKERITLIRRFLKVIHVDQIIALLGDREFVGTDWLNFMENLKIPYIMRIKQNTKMRHKNGGEVQAKLLFAHLALNEHLSMNTKIWGIKVHVSCLKMAAGELLILASTRTIGIDVLEAYRSRWPIERTFLCLKSRGFQFESTHLKDNDKLSKLMSIAVFALAISVKTGKLLDEITPIKIKNHGRKLYSLFTYGIDLLKSLLLNKSHKKNNYLYSKIMEIVLKNNQTDTKITELGKA